jgi:hypothetical protein
LWQLAPAASHFSTILSLFAPSIWHLATVWSHVVATAGDTPAAIQKTERNGKRDLQPIHGSSSFF